MSAPTTPNRSPVDVSPSKRTTSSAPSRIPRPPNAYMLYRSAMCQELRKLTKPTYLLSLPNHGMQCLTRRRSPGSTSQQKKRANMRSNIPDTSSVLSTDPRLPRSRATRYAGLRNARRCVKILLLLSKPDATPLRQRRRSKQPRRWNASISSARNAKTRSWIRRRVRLPRRALEHCRRCRCLLLLGSLPKFTNPCLRSPLSYVQSPCCRTLVKRGRC
ncbi:hypothetical protein CYLTODRAFT_39194 [Cylindrobasidium torrendii FP15055 ss-10]|uniref:Uncharacterized protein n=1 Tax=Cylindrobasidium torrendii FP15055 ss-10 TaxID=1314674 RepID=A0A0D7B6T5_9AGAR|nr:hypothetical protein CYLTODRAFT_39194 [Cylindrobasidium torrendii FP15055 ss-10]